MFRPTVVTTFLIASTLVVACSSNPFAKRTDQPAPNIVLQNKGTSTQEADSDSSAFNLFKEGEGRLTWQGQGDRPLRAVSVSGRDDKAELAFEDKDGQLVRLSGNLVSRTPTMMLIDFTHSGDADASGSLRVKYQASANAIDNVTGNGVLDGRPFSVEFGQNVVKVPTPPTPASTQLPRSVVLSASKPSVSPPSFTSVPVQPPVQPPQAGSGQSSTAAIELPADRLVRPDINLSQQGGGVFTEAGHAKSLSSAAVTGRENGRVDVVLHFGDAQQIRFMGSVEQKDAGAIVIRLLNADNAAATGRVTVQYNADNSIQTLLGDGTLDAKPFSIQFSP